MCVSGTGQGRERGNIDESGEISQKLVYRRAGMSKRRVWFFSRKLWREPGRNLNSGQGQ